MGWFERPEFGANVGLIDEIYRQYLDNPESVSPAWRDFFAENEPGDDGEEAAAAEGRVEAEGGQARQAQAAAPPTPQEAPPAEADQGPAARAEERPRTERPKAEPEAEPDRPRAERPKAERAKPDDRPKPKAERPKGEPEGDGRAEPQLVPLRGAAARIVEAMEASREVPTATSVRTVPARLLEVNRSVL